MPDPTRVQAIFLLAAEELDPAARAALLDRECGTDADLRRRVEVLLGAHEDSGDFLVNPIVSPARGEIPTHLLGDPSQSASGTAPIPDLGDRFRLLQRIGEGGMGEVWKAEQREPVRRTVAIKLIKPGMDSTAVLARFEAERQALALMDHPNISRVLDGGATLAGRPFFVMEFVRGVPLTEYCDVHHLTVEERLRIFAQVCAAVQHAHQKGVIHRDLKPGNILVAEADGKPVPKVIDFGLAKALDASTRLTDRTLHTSIGTIVGTPLYMAPEQMGTNVLDVDTRVDVYSLGVILYELLTGTTPIEKQRFKEAAWEEVRRLIREEEPPRPSTRLSSSDALPSIAAQRHVEPTRLGRLVRGDLDWIVMKALDKDRNRRYETANGFAQDVQRYLAGEVVEASPPSRGYRMMKFVRRNRGAVIAVGLVLFALLAGLGGTTWGMVRADRARQAESDARVRESERAEAEAAAKVEAAAQRDRAQTEAAIATAIRRYLERDLLQVSNPFLFFEGDPDLKVRTALTRAGATIKGRFNDQPLVEASLRTTIGEALMGVGSPLDARPHLERAIGLFTKYSGPNHPLTLQAMNLLGRSFWITGPAAEGINHGEESYARHRAAAGPAYGPDGEQTLIAKLILGGIYTERGMPGRAVPVLEECLKQHRASFGEADRRTLAVMGWLGRAYLKTNQLGQAADMLEDCRAKSLAALGRDAVETGIAIRALSLARVLQGRDAEVLKDLEDMVARCRAKLGEDHYGTQITEEVFGRALIGAGRATDAARVLEHCLQVRTARNGPYHPETKETFRLLMWAYQFGNEHDKAEAAARKYLVLFNDHRPPLDGDVASAATALGRALIGLGKAAEAEPHLRHALDLRVNGQQHMFPEANTRAALGSALLAAKKPAEAEPLLLAGFAGMKKCPVPPSPGIHRRHLADAAGDLGALYEKLARPAEAEKWRATQHDLLNPPAKKK